MPCMFMSGRLGGSRRSSCDAASQKEQLPQESFDNCSGKAAAGWERGTGKMRRTWWRLGVWPREEGWSRRSQT